MGVRQAGSAAVQWSKQAGLRTGRWIKRNKNKPVFVAVVTAVLTAAGTLWAAQLTSDSTRAGADIAASATRTGAEIAAAATLEQVDRQVKQDQEKESRSKAIEAYKRFLESVDAFTIPLLDLPDEKPGAVPTGLEVITAPGAAPMLDFAAGFLTESGRLQLKKAENDIYIYGSDDAWNAADKLYEFLIESAEATLLESAPPFDAVKYDELYKAFRLVFCQEATPNPREGCSE